MTTISQSLPASPSLSQPTLGSHVRSLWAVVRREWMYFIRYPTWVFALLVWPAIFPVAYIFTARALAGPDNIGLQTFSKLTGSNDYIGYIIVGTTIWMWQNVVLWNVGFALRNEQWRGTLETNWMAPTWRFIYLLGSSIPQLISMMMFLAVSALEFGLIYGVRFQGSPWLALLMLLVSIPPIYGIGFAFASLVIAAKEANAFVFLVRGLVMIFCGITFPISMLPGWMQKVAAWIPPTYIIHGFRTAILTNAKLTDLVPDLIPLLAFGAFWLTAGYLLFIWMDRRSRKTGSIGQY